MPLLIELLREVTRVANNSCDESVRIEGELDSKFGVEVNEWVGVTLFVLNSVLSADLSYHSNTAIWQLDVLFVELEVLLERVLDILVLENLLVNDAAQVLQNHVDLGDRRGLDEVLHDLLLDACHAAPTTS